MLPLNKASAFPVVLVILILVFNLESLAVKDILVKLFRFPTTSKVAVSTSVIALSFFFLYYNKGSIKLPRALRILLSSMNNGFGFNSSAARRLAGTRNIREQKFAAKNGGEPGGISNDGNTCFMNSVIQSLASSRELLKFIDSYIYSEVEIDDPSGKVMLHTKTPKSGLVFTTALKTLIDEVNGKYGLRGKEFSTRPLLNKMPNGPKQNFFTGYNQEDAQEFYQLVMRLLEEEFKKDKAEKKEGKNEIIERSAVKHLISGTQSIGSLGKVYVPANQVDTNLKDGASKVFPLDLVTPVDGVSAERIGCLTCGEVGGIRYSVTSGLSLNLPYRSSYNSGLTLEGLLDEWTEPEIIEDVNCNRCGLVQTKDFLLKQLDSTANVKIQEQFHDRLQRIDTELKKPCITDEVFEKLTIKQMIRKTRKCKQIFLSRPPPLLCIHLNRSVFDPNTFRIAKNASNVAFEHILDLSRFIVEPEDVNMDARQPFRKQDARRINEQDGSSYPRSSLSPSTDEDVDSSNEQLTPSTKDTDFDSISSGTVNPDLKYNLKAVISHYGTHNYGHYICYRKLRDTWWRISDESVYVANEQEALSGQGAFMMFYEYDDGYKEKLIGLTPQEQMELDNQEREERSVRVNPIRRTPVSYDSSDSSSQDSPTDSLADSGGSPASDSQGDHVDIRALLSSVNRDSDDESDTYNVGDERAHL